VPPSYWLDKSEAVFDLPFVNVQLKQIEERLYASRASAKQMAVADSVILGQHSVDAQNTGFAALVDATSGKQMYPMVPWGGYKVNDGVAGGEPCYFEAKTTMLKAIGQRGSKSRSAQTEAYRRGNVWVMYVTDKNSPYWPRLEDFGASADEVQSGRRLARVPDFQQVIMGVRNGSIGFHRDAKMDELTAQFRDLATWLGQIVGIKFGIIGTAEGDSLPTETEPALKALVDGLCDPCSNNMESVVELLTHDVREALEAKGYTFFLLTSDKHKRHAQEVADKVGIEVVTNSVLIPQRHWHFLVPLSNLVATLSDSIWKAPEAADMPFDWLHSCGFCGKHSLDGIVCDGCNGGYCEKCVVEYDPKTHKEDEPLYVHNCRWCIAYKMALASVRGLTTHHELCRLKDLKDWPMCCDGCKATRKARHHKRSIVGLRKTVDFAKWQEKPTCACVPNSRNYIKDESGTIAQYDGPVGSSGASSSGGQLTTCDYCQALLAAEVGMLDRVIKNFVEAAYLQPDAIRYPPSRSPSPARRRKRAEMAEESDDSSDSDGEASSPDRKAPRRAGKGLNGGYWAAVQERRRPQKAG